MRWAKMGVCRLIFFTSGSTRPFSLSLGVRRSVAPSFHTVATVARGRVSRVVG